MQSLQHKFLEHDTSREHRQGAEQGEVYREGVQRKCLDIGSSHLSGSVLAAIRIPGQL